MSAGQAAQGLGEINQLRTLPCQPSGNWGWSEQRPRQERHHSLCTCVCVYTECDSSLSLLRNASISMNVETVGEHTVKFEDKALREGIVRMLKGNSSKPVWVSVDRTQPECDYLVVQWLFVFFRCWNAISLLIASLNQTNVLVVTLIQMNVYL